MGLVCLTATSCGSSGGSGGSGGSEGASGSSTESGCELVSLDAVKEEFPDFAIDEAETTGADGSTDACEFTGKPKAGAMGEYTDATTVTLTVGTYDDEATGEEAFTAATEAEGAETETESGYEVTAASGKAVAKFDDGTYAFATIASPELDDPGTAETTALIALLAANQ